MDTSAALTGDEVVALRNPQATFEDSANRVADARLRTGVTPLGIFEESLRVKVTLDQYEGKARSDPTWQRLSILLNCEYMIATLNRGTPLRYNPFLSHWVEALQSLAKAPSASETRFKVDGSLRVEDIRAVRTEMIKSLLRADDPSQFARCSPRMLYESVVEHAQTSEFNVEPYVQMLEEEGIYERSPATVPVAQGKQKQAISNNINGQPIALSAPGNQTAATGTKSDIDADRPQTKLSDKQRWSQDLLSRLNVNPKSAITELTHLPVELTYLDFLTTLLQDQTLQKLDIPASPIIRDYIQHALRLAERMGEPAHPGPPPVAESSSSSTPINGSNDGPEYGRAAQTRTVTLLLLFMRNLIRKGLVEPEEIYFEIQEICVRYVWIKEVREFKKFIEEGEGVEDEDGFVVL